MMSSPPRSIIMLASGARCTALHCAAAVQLRGARDDECTHRRRFPHSVYQAAVDAGVYLIEVGLVVQMVGS